MRFLELKLGGVCPPREKSTWWVTLNTSQQVQFYDCLVA